MTVNELIVLLQQWQTDGLGDMPVKHFNDMSTCRDTDWVDFMSDDIRIEGNFVGIR